MSNIEHDYLHLISYIAANGREKGDRTGTGTRQIFGAQLRQDLSKGFPLLTTKKVHFRSVVAELLWFLSGSTNVKELQALGCTIWDEWAREDGDLGPIYGKQWRAWTTSQATKVRSEIAQGGGAFVEMDFVHVDQITSVIDSIRRDPNGRRHIVSAWNVGDLDKMALAPCHALFQFDVTDGRLSCQLYQRSCDMFLGVPFNIASYALLTHMVAQQCDLEVGDFIWTGGDSHVYQNHFDQVKEQCSREPRDLPQLKIKHKPRSIFDYRIEDFELVGYEPHASIKAPVAV